MQGTTGGSSDGKGNENDLAETHQDAKVGWEAKRIRMLRLQAKAAKAAKSETKSYDRTRFEQAKEGKWKKGWELSFGTFQS